MRTVPYLVAACLVASAASAHEFWLLPATFTPELGEEVAVRLFVGDGFANGEPYPRNPGHVRSFELHGGEEVTRIDGRAGEDPAGRFLAEPAGVLAIAYRSYPSSLTLAADKFEGYLAEEGLEHVSRLRAEAGESEKDGSETFSRCAKSLMRAAGRETTGYDRRVGLELEIVPLAPPFELTDEGTLPIQVRWRDAPLAGAQVRLFLQDQPERTTEVRTRDDGTVDLELGAPGVWMLSVVHMERAPEGSGFDWKSTWSSLTFEVVESGEGPPLTTPPSGACI